MTECQIAYRESEQPCTRWLAASASPARCSELAWLIRAAIAWAEARAAEIAAAGAPLTASGRRLARSVGVRRPELIRISEVNEIRLPLGAALRSAAFGKSLPSDLVGLTLGYSIEEIGRAHV